MAKTKITVYPELSLDFELTGGDLSRIVGLVRQWLNRPANPLKRVSPEKLTLALIHAMEYLLADRIDRGDARGGWGHSDKPYMRLLYGPRIANQVQESVMTTVVVVHALHDCLLRMGRCGIRISGHAPEDLLNFILGDLDLYLKGRWDGRKGHGGVRAPGREGDSTQVPRYRHTAWLFHLWHLLPKYRDRLQLTATNLLSEFDTVDWKSEKVATAVAAYSAFSLLLENTALCESLGGASLTRVKYLKYALEGQIESKFSSEFSGWTSGKPVDGGRQLYTLFVCAEMACMYPRPEETLTKQMRTALHATITGEWRSSDGRGVPLKPGGQGDISASSLAASALIRKAHCTAEEETSLLRVVDFLVESLAQGRDAMGGTFSWALSYFVRDISRYLATESE